MNKPSPAITKSVEAVMAGVVIGVCGTLIIGCTAYLWAKDIKNSLIPPREDLEKDKQQ
jgi:hypothetical protein